MRNERRTARAYNITAQNETAENGERCCYERRETQQANSKKQTCYYAKARRRAL
jgi:hypothetical protein